MKKFLFAFVLSATAMIAHAQPPNVPAEAGANFGVKTTADGAISVEELYTSVQGKEKAMPVKLKGVVTEVCKMEGCWIKVKSTNGDMMVKMKDHKFTVPVILNGKTIVIDGTAEEKLTTVEQLRHFAEDAGKSKAEIAKITVPKREVIVQANGILVL